VGGALLALLEATRFAFNKICAMTIWLLHFSAELLVRVPPTQGVLYSPASQLTSNEPRREHLVFPSRRGAILIGRYRSLTVG